MEGVAVVEVEVDVEEEDNYDKIQQLFFVLHNYNCMKWDMFLKKWIEWIMHFELFREEFWYPHVHFAK